MKPLRAALAVAIALGTAAAACGGAQDADFGWFGHVPRRSVAQGPIRVRWAQRLTSPFSTSYVPVEHSVPALDPRRNRVYVGTVEGGLWALNGGGGAVYRYATRAPVESQPMLDAAADELYVGADDGLVHALRASDGKLRWRASIGTQVRKPPVLSPDAVYVVSEGDVVMALARRSGETLWRYKRDPPEGFSVTGHAGLTLERGKLLAAFTDGMVVALDPSDGRPVWERDTALDIEETSDGVPRFLDVDTTPIVVGADVYVASFAAGLYALDFVGGGVRWRDAELTGVTAIVRAGEDLVLSSADQGVLAIDLADRRVRWRHPVTRGAAGPPVVSGPTILVGETLGSFLALKLSDGAEVGRFESGTGFGSPAATAGGRGYVVSNGGSLFAFDIVPL